MTVFGERAGPIIGAIEIEVWGNAGAAPAREVQSIPEARTAPDFAVSESLESFVFRLRMKGHVVDKYQQLSLKS